MRMLVAEVLLLGGASAPDRSIAPRRPVGSFIACPIRTSATFMNDEPKSIPTTDAWPQAASRATAPRARTATVEGMVSGRNFVRSTLGDEGLGLRLRRAQARSRRSIATCSTTHVDVRDVQRAPLISLLTFIAIVVREGVRVSRLDREASTSSYTILHSYY